MADSNSIVAVMEVKRGYGVGHANFYLAHIGDSGKLEGISDYDNDGKYAGLAITSQFELDNPDNVYAWRVEYRDVGDVTYTRSDVMHTTLKAIDRKMQHYHAEWGNCESYAQFVQRALKALGVKQVVCTHKSNGEQYQNNEFVTWKVADVPYLVGQVIYHFQQVLA